MDQYIVKNGKKLRYGYTTGSCAAAAAKAAAGMLLDGNIINTIEIDTPKGWPLRLQVYDGIVTETQASCGVIKDAGDDPDITNGIRICSRVGWRRDSSICIKGGAGVGRVTRPGLPVAVGEAAINPVPLRMIEEEVRKVIGYTRGMDIEIYVPEGEVIGQRTFNPRLGIVGGISILGTTGIVEPMSEEAFKDSLALELQMAKAEGLNKLVLVPGNYGRDVAKNIYRIDDKYIFKTSNFIGFMLDKALEIGFNKILFIGHLGKIVKVAGGIFHTHSHIADGRLEILTAHLALMAAPLELLEKVMESNTTEEATEWILKYNYQEVFQTLAKTITDKCRQRTFNKIQLATVIFSMQEGVLAQCPSVIEIMEEFKDE